MKEQTALIVLEHHFIMDRDRNVWSERVIDKMFWCRYLTIFSKIIVLARIQNSNDTSNFIPVNCKAVEFYGLPDFKGVKNFIQNIPSVIYKFKKAQNKVDKVIFRGPSPLSLLLFTHCKKPYAVEFVMGADKFIENSVFINNLIDKRAKAMCLHANGVSYVTEYRLQEHYPCQALLKGLNKNFFVGSYSSIDLADDYYFERDWDRVEKPIQLQLLHTGYMDNFRKGQDILIKAASIVINHGYDIKITLIGDGLLQNNLKKLAKDLGIADRIIFIGAITDKNKLREYYRKAHLFVFPSHSEGLPRSIIEAMSNSMPVIASSVDGIPEIVQKDFIINGFNPRDYAEKIIFLFNNWDYVKKLGKENYVVSQKFRKDVLDSKRFEFYKKLLEI